ncbi:protein kinase [Oscillatoria sp. FACHB-1407]|uniref:serine/threonine-protein kinase n=1 Tax=Oscillatoria sp. FACHB-1407 TaxID=2692847 RepID=UPI00168832CF|nr:serine/threonine-protein kinase [Oscillatoria sp. FACHB-1407]MBD2464124.1 protein kinase [Oscillatoria sp. FACHB-1407]
MQPPISAGTVLQNRYRLLSILGQGGFGRTYLAEDLGRFQEKCALKEFIPTQIGAYALEKSKELFQREAAILYQIQHPQIPQFRATFEENQRLFLVQDYVDGKTYRTLLNERKPQGLAFSEAEVLLLVRQLLPVLAHIHSKGIIHRDIAPDNIILRQQDQLPVLIDFGVVKEIVTRVQATQTMTQATTVGKLGYAPSEQMQTGRAYPNSDLYSLAVTAIVLLTGREPQELYDDVNLTWHWQRLVNVSPGFAQILNRMLSYRPGDRYQSVSEVAQALQAMLNPAAMPPSMPVATAGAPVGTAPQPNVSQMQTLAVGRRPDPAPVGRNPRNPDPMVPVATEQSVWDNPWAVIGIGMGLAVVTGIGAWAVVSAILNTQPTPVASPTPSVTVSVTPTPTPTQSSQPVQFSQRLNLAPGAATTAEGSLRANETITYIISAEQGEILSADLEGEGVLMTVLAPNRELVDDRSNRVQSWQGTLNFNGDYYLQLSPVQGVDRTNYRLNLNLEAPEPSPTPTPTPTPPPEPEVNTQRLNFPDGETQTEVSDRASDLLIQRYLVNARAGQILNVELIEGAGSLNIYYPNGQLVEDASGVVFWQAQLPESGDYAIDVLGNQEVDFTLRVSVTDSQ